MNECVLLMNVVSLCGVLGDGEWHALRHAEGVAREEEVEEQVEVGEDLGWCGVV